MLVISERSIWRCSPLLDSAASTRHMAMLRSCGASASRGEIVYQREPDAIDQVRQIVAKIELRAFGHGNRLSCGLATGQLADNSTTLLQCIYCIYNSCNCI